MSHAFRLVVGEDRLATLTFNLADRKVNIFTREVLEELDETIPQLARRTDIGCLILCSGKPGSFIAGADVEAIAGVTDPELAAAGSRLGHRIFAAWEALPFPTVAAINGTCLGGGTELSLASTYRVASDRPDLRIGLPEIKLGILPGWGGSTRLPAVVGVAAALDLILTGRNLVGKQALRMGLVDALLPDATFLGQVREFALGKRDARRRGTARRGGWQQLLLEGNPLGRKLIFDQARKKTLAQTKGQYPAALKAIEVVRTAVSRGRQAGFAAEAQAVGELATGRVSKNLVHVFHLMEGLKKEGARPPGEPRKLAQAAVLGAGVMGGGIAHIIAEQANIPVRLKDIQEAALASGLAHAASLVKKKLDRRRISRPEAQRTLALLRPGLDYSGFERVDLVIEAVIEKLPIKQQVMADVARATGPEAILASNTSSLSIDAIAELTPNPARVVGMHFFNPVDKMPLVEVIKGRRTSPTAVATVFDFARKLGKTPVLVKDGPGFLVNRLLMFYSTEALWLLDEGHSIEDIDRAMTAWGMPMGPIALTDEVGIDVAVKVGHILGDAFGDRLPVPPWLDKAVDPKRLGTKTGLGFYRYEGRKRLSVDPAIYGLLGLVPRVKAPNHPQLADRMVLPMVNEAARCLAEGVVADPGSLDLAMIMGTGFPPFRGGLCRWADGEGLNEVVVRLERLAGLVGERFQPCDALRKAAAAGGFYASRS